MSDSTQRRPAPESDAPTPGLGTSSPEGDGVADSVHAVVLHTEADGLSDAPLHRQSALVRRLCLALGLGLTFGLMSSIFVPRDTEAQDEASGSSSSSTSTGSPMTGGEVTDQSAAGGDEEAQAQDGRAGELIPGAGAEAGVPGEARDAMGPVASGPGDADPHIGLPMLGSLESRSHTVHIFGTTAGPRYTVYRRGGGEAITILMSREQLTLSFPEVPLPTRAEGVQQALVMPTDSGLR